MPGYQLVTDWCFAALLCVAGVIDLRSRIIHPRAVLAMLALAAARIALDIAAGGTPALYIFSGLIAGAATFLVFLLMYRLTKGVGFGDVKLMGVVGLYYGVRGVFTVVFVSMLLVAGAGVVMIARDRGKLKATLPLAPFVAAAAILREVVLLVEGV